MDRYTHCPYCGNYLHNYNGNNHCNNCDKDVAPVTIDVGDVSAAIYAQADSASKMLAALVHTQALPVVTLLEGWWTKLDSRHQQGFVTALLYRVLTLLHNGFLDSQLKPIVTEHFTPEVLAERVKKLVENEEDADAVSACVARHVSQQLDKSGHSRVITDALQDTIREIARQRSMDQREVIEAAVRDRMPDIEEMTKRIVEEVADDAAREVRSRMRRNS